LKAVAAVAVVNLTGRIILTGRAGASADGDSDDSTRPELLWRTYLQTTISVSEMDLLEDLWEETIAAFGRLISLHFFS
jgi:hypothetical protein